MLDYFKNSNISTSFFYADVEKMSSLRLIFTFRYGQRIVENPIEISLYPLPNRKIYYNLHGEILKGISLDWWPWMKHEKCNAKVSETRG